MAEDFVVLRPPIPNSSSLPNKLLKKPASFVLGSSKSSTYPPRVRLRFQLACGLADGLFEQLAEIFVPHVLTSKG